MQQIVCGFGQNETASRLQCKRLKEFLISLIRQRHSPNMEARRLQAWHHLGQDTRLFPGIDFGILGNIDLAIR